MSQTKCLLNRKQEKKDYKEVHFWLLWIIICLLGWLIYKPAFWGILIPIIRIMFVDWKKENENINKELGDV